MDVWLFEAYAEIAAEHDGHTAWPAGALHLQFVRVPTSGFDQDIQTDSWRLALQVLQVDAFVLQVVVEA